MARRWPVKTLWTRWSIWACWSRKRRAALAIDDEVVADLVDDDAADAERDALVGDAVDGQLGLAQVEREPADRLHAGEHQGALAGDDLEAEALLDARRWRCCGAGPEMISASLGSATRHISLNIDEQQDDRPEDDATMMTMFHCTSSALQGGDDDGAGREVLDHQDHGCRSTISSSFSSA